MALFPFLAVLICTMGSLIVVLVVLARQAQTQAAQATSEKASQWKQEIQNQGDMAQWRIEQLQEAAGKAREEMSDARLELGHLEETSQQLRRQFESLQAAWQELENLKRPTAGDRKAAAAELDRRREQSHHSSRRAAWSPADQSHDAKHELDRRRSCLFRTMSADIA